MALPKFKRSKSKKRQRRAHDALTPKGRSTCPRCNTEKLPHRICSNCGYYKGVSKLAVEGY